MIRVQFPSFVWNEQGETASSRGVDLQYSAEIRDRRDLLEFVQRSGAHVLQEVFPGDLAPSELFHRILSLDEPSCARLLTFLRSFEESTNANVVSPASLTKPASGQTPPSPANAKSHSDSLVQINYVDRIISVGERQCPVLDDDSWLYYTSVIEANGAWVSTAEMLRAYNKKHPEDHQVERLNATKAREKPGNPILENLIETGHEGSRLKSEFCRA